MTEEQLRAIAWRLRRQGDDIRRDLHTEAKRLESMARKLKTDGRTPKAAARRG